MRLESVPWHADCSRRTSEVAYRIRGECEGRAPVKLGALCPRSGRNAVRSTGLPLPTQSQGEGSMQAELPTSTELQAIKNLKQIAREEFILPAPPSVGAVAD